jgi:transposase
MFLRKITTKGKAYLNIIKSYRKEGKTKHKSIASFGCIDNLDEEEIKKLGLSLIKYCNEKANFLDIDTAKEKDRKNWGAVRLIKKIWETFDFPKILKKICKDRKIKFNYFSAIFLMLVDRMFAPKSKLGVYEKQSFYYGIEENDLQHLYRALDLLSEKKEELEEYIFEKNTDLFKMSVDVVLYDVTTFHFESVRSDILRDFGYSKDCKFNEVQIVMSLLVDLEGRPVGYELYEGNVYEGHTLKDAIEKIKNRFKINKLIFIADRAMLSKDNIDLIKNSNYEYIISSRLKNKTAQVKEEVLSETDYMSISTEDKEEEFKYKEIKKFEITQETLDELDGKISETGKLSKLIDKTFYRKEFHKKLEKLEFNQHDIKQIMSEAVKNDRIICSWSKKRARKDKLDRDRLIEKAQNMVQKTRGRLISQKGALRYIDISSKITGKLKYEKIQEDEKWDGYYGIETNCEITSPEKILDYYHQLWRVEESFRIFKSHLEARPMFHWNPNRIKGHMVLCFIAFLIERTIEIELKKANINYSATKIREALIELQFSEITVEDKTFFLRAPVQGLANDILRAFRIKIPPHITTPDNF